MKVKILISGILLAVYSLTLVHSVIPHDHCEQTAAGKAVMICIHEEAHDHDAPHHDESQHIDEYVFTVQNLLSQFAFQPIICSQAQTFDLSPVACKIQNQDSYFISKKIPNQFAEAVPLRAPPAC